MRRLLVVMSMLAGAWLATAETAAADDVSPGCVSVDGFGTLVPTSPLIPESRHVMDTLFGPGEVVTVEFTGAVGSGWLSIADASGAFGNPFLDTTSVPSTLTYTFDGSETGVQVFTVAATADVRCGPQVDDGLPDLDGDGVVDDADMCDDTDLAADTAPDRQLRNRLWVDPDGTFLFGDGTESGFTVADTGGCSASQIIAAAGLGNGHSKFGISKGAFHVHLAGQTAEATAPPEARAPQRERNGRS